MAGVHPYHPVLQPRQSSGGGDYAGRIAHPETGVPRDKECVFQAGQRRLLPLICHYSILPRGRSHHRSPHPAY